jgi:Flavin containing amine oxidoreductase
VTDGAGLAGYRAAMYRLATGRDGTGGGPFNDIPGKREGNLHFAGEQTSVNYQGYIEGGLRSGYRCATDVAGR